MKESEEEPVRTGILRRMEVILAATPKGHPVIQPPKMIYPEKKSQVVLTDDWGHPSS